MKRIPIQRIEDASATALDVVGDLYCDGSGKVYKYVKYLAGTGVINPSSGDVVVYAAAGTATVTVDLTDASTIPVGAGVIPWDNENDGSTSITHNITDIIGSTAVAASAIYLWIQVGGPTTLSTAIESSNNDTPIAAADGSPLNVGDADKTLRAADSYVAADTVTRGPEPVVATAIDASAKTVICNFPH